MAVCTSSFAQHLAPGLRTVVNRNYEDYLASTWVNLHAGIDTVAVGNTARTCAYCGRQRIEIVATCPGCGA